MISPLHAFMAEVCGATTSVTIVSDNAVAPAYTMSQERQESNYGLPLKPTRPNRIAAKGISYLASVLPPEMELAMKKSATKAANDTPKDMLALKKLPCATILGALDSSLEESTSSFEDSFDEICSLKKSKASSHRESRSSTSKSHVRHHKSHVRHHKRAADKVVTAAFAA